MRSLVVLGATGSVGRSTLDVAARHPERLRVSVLTAQRDAAGLFELVVTHRPERAALVDPVAADELRRRLREAGVSCEVLAGAAALESLAAEGGDIVMSAIVGAAGLLPTLSAIRAGRQVLIANKEPLVMAGRLMMGEGAAHGATVIPIDSEHNAIFQCLPPASRCGIAPQGVRRLILTASGGPFRTTPRADLDRVTAAQAVRHPNWTMGPKISVDSATLMNKGLELIEAAALYRLPPDRLDVVVHPESIIHSLVEYVDGSTLAQLGQPDMRVPIAHALAYPERWESGVGGLDLAQLAQLRFEAPDLDRFPSLKLARSALAEGEILPNVLNAANEIAVEAFLKGALGFMGIPELVERCCEAAAGAHLAPPRDLEAVLEVDAWARRFCRDRLQREAGTIR